MLTGKRVFQGDTVSDTISAIIRGEPDWSALAQESPSSIRKLLGRCLVKDATHRLQDIGDARIEIQERLAGGTGDEETERAAAPVTGKRRGRDLAIAALGATIAVFLVVSFLAWSPKVIRRWLGSVTVVRSSINLPGGRVLTGMSCEGLPTLTAMALSPDGQTLVFSAGAEGSASDVDPLRRWPSGLLGVHGGR
jgi:serine/threonine-protein kinase